MNLLIWTQPGDVHAIAVDRVLSARGHRVDRLFSGDVPTRAVLSTTVSAEGRRDAFIPDGGQPVVLAPDVVWMRRPHRPIMPDEGAPEDRESSRRDCEALVEGLWHATARDAVWVNSFSGETRGESKALQLQSARAAGLAIPETLISNNPDEIRAFLAEIGGMGIYKPFLPDRWVDETGAVARMRCVRVTADDLPADGTLRRTPGIFQAYIDKSSEVRATFFGACDVSVELRPRSDLAPTVDIKDTHHTRLHADRIALPKHIHDACLQVMAALDLKFASFDFVRRGNDWTFLEVNQMGQFLWLERMNPDIPLLSVAAQYFETVLSGELFQPRDDGVRLSEVFPLSQSAEVTEAEVRNHASNYRPPHADGVRRELETL